MWVVRVEWNVSGTKRCWKRSWWELQRFDRVVRQAKWTKRRDQCCVRPSWTGTLRTPRGTAWGWRFTSLRDWAKKQTERLAPGMVITIEPGIYVPGKGGIRIEDMVVVTERGCEMLTPVTKDLIEIEAS